MTVALEMAVRRAKRTLGGVFPHQNSANKATFMAIPNAGIRLNSLPPGTMQTDLLASKTLHFGDVVVVKDCIGRVAALALTGGAGEVFDIPQIVVFVLGHSDQIYHWFASFQEISMLLETSFRTEHGMTLRSSPIYEWFFHSADWHGPAWDYSQLGTTMRLQDLGFLCQRFMSDALTEDNRLHCPRHHNAFPTLFWQIDSVRGRLLTQAVHIFELYLFHTHMTTPAISTETGAVSAIALLETHLRETPILLSEHEELVQHAHALGFLKRTHDE
jgi:hypothetical protein